MEITAKGRIRIKESWLAKIIDILIILAFVVSAGALIVMGRVPFHEAVGGIIPSASNLQFILVLTLAFRFGQLANQSVTTGHFYLTMRVHGDEISEALKNDGDDSAASKKDLKDLKDDFATISLRRACKAVAAIGMWILIAG